MENDYINQLSDLSEVLIPFETVRLKNASIVYFNRDLSLSETSDEVLKACSFKIVDDVSSLFDEKKTFYAERYGGDGILRNGGGGRCGYDGRYLVKGIGPNSLVGENFDQSHADGRLTLHDAIYEAIWGEVIDLALPFGAIKTIAIVLTKEKFFLGARQHHRVLSVREPVVRPAHFVRALYYRERKDSGLEKDFRRVKAAIKKLVLFLPISDFAYEPGEPLELQIRHGFVALAKRFACQFASARAKRILHYNVSASNVSIEGAWLDLTRTTIFSDCLIRDKLDVDRFVGEFTPVIQALRHISFYCYKYLGVSRDDSREIFKSAVYAFSKEYNFKLNLGLMAQAGFPIAITSKLHDSEQFRRMALLLRSVLEQEGYGVSEVKSSDGWDGFEFDIAETLRAMLIRCLEKSKESFRCEDVRSSPGFEVYELFFNYVCEEAMASGITKVALIRGMFISITKFMRTPRLLHLNILDEAIEDLIGQFDEHVLSADGVQNFIDDVKKMALLCLRYDEGLEVTFWKTSEVEILYKLTSDRFILLTQGKTEILTFAELKALDLKCRDIKSALSFYQDIWSVLL